MPAIAPEAPKLLLTREECAKLLGCSVRFVDSSIKAGSLHPTRLGRLVRLHRDEVERFAREGSL